MSIKERPREGTIIGDYEVLVSEDAINQIVDVLADDIAADYEGKRLLLVGILTGSFIFLADLARELQRRGLEIDIDFMKLSSYGSGTESSREPRILLDLSRPIKGRDVLIVEDIKDTGYSLRTASDILRARNPNSLEICALVSKPGRKETDVNIKYLGFTIPNEWVVGVGLDENEMHRALPYIARKIPKQA
jgi:hypoxanthine phosphoribosyltransferase